jgi:antitoxin Phd
MGMKACGLRSVAGEKRRELQEAKDRLSRVVEQALEKGPQTITLRGKPAVVVLSVKDFEKLTRPSQSLIEFFRGSPLQGVELDLKRSKDLSRKVDL